MVKDIVDAIGTITTENPLAVFSFFIIGVLLIIIIQNSFYYFVYKDKAYLWYVIYALIIFTDQVLINFISYQTELHQDYYVIYKPLHPALEWLYNSAYLIFVVEFGGLYLMNNITAKRIKSVVFMMTGLLLILFLFDVFSGTLYVGSAFLFIQVPMLIVLSILIFYHLFQMKTNMKYYIIPGSLAFSIFSILALASSVLDFGFSQLSWGFFYIGVFIENIFFSLGLVVKQKLVLKERNESQQALIVQYEENEFLKNNLADSLRREVHIKTTEIISLNEKAEAEKIKKMEIAFEKELAELKVSSLQSQMNPHFIFNSLNSIKLYIIKNDNENAVYYLNKFSKLIRKILSASRHKVVSLQEELDTVVLYANIENIRFKNEINFTLNVSDQLNLLTIKIPPLILQPFIENAIWHGLSSYKGDKKLDISVNKRDDYFVEIIVKDNGIGRKKSTELKDKKLHKKQSLGLKITEERLEHFSLQFENKHQINFRDLTDGPQPLGTEAIILIPIV